MESLVAMHSDYVAALEAAVWFDGAPTSQVRPVTASLPSRRPSDLMAPPHRRCAPLPLPAEAMLPDSGLRPRPPARSVSAACGTTEPRHVDRPGQLGEFEQESNTLWVITVHVSHAAMHPPFDATALHSATCTRALLRQFAFNPPQAQRC